MVKTRREASISRLVTDELLAFISAEREGLEREALPLLDELEALVEAGGKRLRPRFCYWGFVAGGGEPGAEIIRVGASHGGARERFGLSAASPTGLLVFVPADRLFPTSVFPADVVLRAAERFDT